MSIKSFASKLANTGKEIIQALLGGQKVPKGHTSTDPIDGGAIEQSTEVLGLIYRTLQRARVEELARRLDDETFNKDQKKLNDDRNQSLIDALTIRKKPTKKVTKPKKETKKEEPSKEPSRGKKEEPTKGKKEEPTKEPTKGKKETKKEEPTAEKIRREEVKKEPVKEPIRKEPVKEPAKPTAEKTKSIPKTSPSEAEKTLESVAKSSGITDPTELSQFLAQTSHESGGFKWLKELGKDSYFEKYNGRKDLGNTEPGDGPRFKGRGFIQLTGRSNYDKFGKIIGVDLINYPELAEEPKNAAALAVAYWKERVKPKIKDFNDTKSVTKIINGGYNGLQDRQTKFEEYSDKVSKGTVGVMLTNQSLPATITPNSTGTKIDQASKENKQMKSAAAVKKSINVNNINTSQTQSTNSQYSSDVEDDDRNAHQKKK